MSAIEFLCPNGHKIRCQAEQAGQPAKCPRCGVKFLVPDAAELGIAASDTVSQSGSGELTLSGNKSPLQGARPRKELQMEFLCPNGHRLYGSVGLAGRAGECPECGARFRIPAYEPPIEDIFTDDRPKDEIRLSHSNSQSGAAPASPVPQEPQAPPVQNRLQPAWDEESVPATIWSVAAGSSLSGQPLATLFARLWTTRPKGARVEIQMRDGETVVIERFMAALSQQSHGVFAIRVSDNTYTLMAVAWDAIERVLVRGLSELPK